MILTEEKLALLAVRLMATPITQFQSSQMSQQRELLMALTQMSS
jgi:hypothetical protein